MIELLLAPTGLRLIAEAGQSLPTNWFGLAGLVIVLLITAVPGLLAVRQARSNRNKLGDVQDGVTSVKDQVTNGGTNLATTVGEVKTMLGIITENQRTIHDQHLTAINRNIATLNEGVQEVRTGLAELKRKFEGGQDDPGAEP